MDGNLVTAVDFSAQFINQDDTDIVVDATMIDAEGFDGVYSVSVEFSKTIESALYDLEILIGSELLGENPVIDLKPCSNFVALERDLVA